jgi:hypothetical protein
MRELILSLPPVFELSHSLASQTHSLPTQPRPGVTLLNIPSPQLAITVFILFGFNNSQLKPNIDLKLPTDHAVTAANYLRLHIPWLRQLTTKVLPPNQT